MSARNLLTAALLTLTFVTGIVDAVSFLALGQAFAAMQTGNVIFLGLGAAGTGGLDVLTPAVSIGAFLLGGILAALFTGRLRAGGRTPSLAGAIAVEAAILAAVAILLGLTDPAARSFLATFALALLALAMGLRNTMVRNLGDADLASTVLNLTLTVLTPDGAGVASGENLGRRALAIAALVAGAVCGALLAKTDAGLAFGLAAVAAAAAIPAAARSSR
jgi:uncharacterized membrane protein YoaK (UPF0700 family)